MPMLLYVAVDYDTYYMIEDRLLIRKDNKGIFLPTVLFAIKFKLNAPGDKGLFVFRSDTSFANFKLLGNIPSLRDKLKTFGNYFC